MTRRERFGLVAGCLLGWAAAAHGDETPETILIRQTLANELSGHRRADVELVASAYEQTFTGLDAHGNADPRAWTVVHEGLARYEEALRQDLAQHRHETARAIGSIHVRGDQALVTSRDSGQVVDRATSLARPLDRRCLWVMRKTEEAWRVALRVDALGDTVLPPPASAAPEPALAQLLGDELSGWNLGKPAQIARHYGERFVGCTAGASFRPENWIVIFSGAEEFRAFLDRRLDNTSYQIERVILSTSVSAQGSDAVVVARERVTTTHAAGDVVHRQDRHVLWILSRRTGAWKADFVCFGVVVAE